MRETDRTHNTERLAQLEQELARLFQLMPDASAGKASHRASVDYWERIENLEEEIKVLKAALKQPGPISGENDSQG